MNQWFQCTVKYEKTIENGAVKKVSEPYLVDAISFTDAEKRIIEEVTPYMTGVFEISDIKKARYAEIFESSDESADRFYRIKIQIITLDEKSGKEKKTTQNLLVQASDINDSLARLDKELKGISSSEMVIVAVSETPLMDIVHYNQSAPE